MPGTAKRRFNSWNIWPAIPRGIISLTAITNGQRFPQPQSTIQPRNPAQESLGKFKAEKLPIAIIGKNQIVAQKILDRAGYK